MNWNELTMAQKSELMQTYIRSGVTSLNDMKSHFNTYANGGPKKTFQEWSQAMKGKYPWLELDSNKAGYDYERYFNENYDDAIARLNEAEARHFTDKYKLPNHPTFSDESIYSKGPSYGGTWTNDGKFVPSVINTQQYPKVYDQNRAYTEEEIYDRLRNGVPSLDDMRSHFNLLAQGGPKDPPKKNPTPFQKALYNSIDPTQDYPGFGEAVANYIYAKQKVRNGEEDVPEYKIGNTLGERVAQAAWAKRLDMPYDETLLPTWNGDTLSIPKELEKEIPVDTNFIKRRIQANRELQERFSKYKDNDYVNAAIKEDESTLEALRKTYKTGKPVGLSEMSWNSRQLLNNGEINDQQVSPLNVFYRYNVRFDPETNRMYYSDGYDFNQYEHFVPGEPFRFRGYIDLNKKDFGGPLDIDINKVFGVHRFDKGGKKKSSTDKVPYSPYQYTPIPRRDIDTLILDKYKQDSVAREIQKQQDEEVDPLERRVRDVQEIIAMYDTIGQISDTRFNAPDRAQMEEVLSYKNREKVSKVLKDNTESNLAKRSSDIMNNIKEEEKSNIVQNELQNMSTDELKAVQRKLADDGYYDSEYRGGNVRNLQKKLVEKGYLDNSSGKEIDGFYGPKTHAAYAQYNRDREVDGILGNKTRNAYYSYKFGNDVGKVHSAIPIAEHDRCAAFVSKLYDNLNHNGKQAGVYGNAWNMVHNIEKAGGEPLFNIYNNEAFANIKSPKELKQATNNYLNNNKIDYSSLSSGDIVGIYIESSSYHKDVLKSGDTYNTHVGYVVGKDEDGTPIVQHNLNGKVKKERIDNLSGSLYGRRATVTAAVRPKVSTDSAQTLIWETAEPDRKVTYARYDEPNEHGVITPVKGETNELRDARVNSYLSSIAGAKKNLAQLFPNADLESVEDIAIGILQRETGFMRKTRDTERSERRSAMFSKDEEMRSQPEVAKIKYNSFTSTDKKILGLTNPKQLNDPVIAGRAVMYLLAKHNDYLNRYANTYNNTSPEEVRDATILSYNQGMGKLYNLGFDEYGEPRNIDWLTEMENPDIKVKSRNRLGQAMQSLGINAQGNLFTNENIPYVASVLQTINNNIERTD